MTRFPATVILVAALAVGGCTRFAIHSDYDRNADFAALHTYAWLPLSEAEPADQRVLDRFIDARLRSAVAKELGAKGYRPAEVASADFLLNYRLATEPAAAVKGRTYGSYLGGGWRGWAGLEGFYAESYDDGTLYIAVLDPRTRQMIWIGAASARLLPHISFEQRQKRVDAAVTRILARFPPA